VLYLDKKINGIYAIASGCAAVLLPVAPAIKSASSAFQELDSIAERLAAEKQTAAAQDLGGANLDNKGLERFKELKRRKSEMQCRTLAVEGHSLHDTIDKRIDSKKYENNLGIVHKVQQDLQRVSDGMLNKRQKKIFPRGDPRIVLFVDDLDRCDHNAVVKVIEALQLLVRAKLFVAVLAIDPRYVTLALEEYYKHILDPRKPPSGMDFLEKIIQIPFRLPGVRQDCVDDFVDSQIVVEDDSSQQAHNPVTDAEKPEDNEEDKKPKAKEPPKAKKTPKANAEPKDESGAAEKSDKALPRDKIKFTAAEGKMMRETFQLFVVCPRCTRRIINVFKVLPVIWKRDSVRLKGDLESKRATLIQMLLASDESTRYGTYMIFDWMELGGVTYHHATGEVSATDENNLATVVFSRENS